MTPPWLNVTSLNTIQDPNSYLRPSTPNPTEGSRPSSAPQPNYLIELLNYAQEITDDLDEYLNGILKTEIKLVLLPFFVEKTELGEGGGRIRRKKRGGAPGAPEIAMVCSNVHNNPVFVDDDDEEGEGFATITMNAIAKHKDQLGGVCNHLNELLKSTPIEDVENFKTECKVRLDEGLLPGQVPSVGVSSGIANGSRSNGTAVEGETVDINSYVLRIGSAMLGLVEHINKHKANNFHGTSVTINFNNGSNITFTIHKSENSYTLYCDKTNPIKQIQIQDVSDISFLQFTGEVIVSVETTFAKVVTANVANANLEAIGENYFDYLKKKATEGFEVKNMPHIEQFKSVNNIHFVYRSKNPLKIEAYIQELRLKVQEAKANAAAKAKANAAKVAKVAKDQATSQVDELFKTLGKYDNLFLFRLIITLLDPGKMSK
jgi:hypothetical protein